MMMTLPLLQITIANTTVVSPTQMTITLKDDAGEQLYSTAGFAADGVTD